MRIRRLNLIRYGHFTDFLLDFGDRLANGLDFHIIFGDNEAGKSTAFNGCLDLFFGFEERSKYSFLHDYNALRVGAALEIDGTIVELARIKRRNANLLGVNAQPVDEGILSSALHRLSREAYQTIFSLNDDTIEQGGEEILASKGDLGRLLFSGSAGLTDLSKRLELLRKRANEIYMERSRTCKIACLHQELKQLKEKQKDLDIQPSAYERLRETHQKTQETYQFAREVQGALFDERSNLKIFKDAFEVWDTLKEFEHKLVLVNHLPDVPMDWFEELESLKKQLASAEEKQENVQSDIDSNNEELEILVGDPAIITVQAELEEIETLAIHNRKASEQLPQLRNELLSVNAKLAEIRQRLGANKDIDLETFVISDDAIANLSDLVENEAQLAQGLATTKKEDSDAEEFLVQAQADEKGTVSPDEKMRELMVLCDRCAEDDAQQRLDLAEKSLSQKYRKIERALKELIPWTGNQNDIKLEDFPTLVQASRWLERANKLEKELDDQKMRQKQCRENCATYDSRVKTLSNQMSTITDAYATNSLKERNDKWAIHRLMLDNKTAEAFEKALVYDDHIRNERLSTVDRLSQLRIAELELSEANGMLKVISGEVNRIEDSLQMLQEEMRPALIKAKLPESFQPKQLFEWLKITQTVQQLVEEEEEYRAERDHAKSIYDQRRLELLKALAEVGAKPSETLDLRDLHTIAKAYQKNAIQDEGKHALAKKAILKAEDHVKRRKKALEKAEAAFENWQKDWRRALEGLWLKQKNVGQIRALLDPLRKLAPLMTSERTLSETIEAQNKDRNQFREKAHKLFGLLSLEVEEDLAIQFSVLQKRLKHAQKTQMDRDSLIKSCTQAEKRLEQAKTEISRIENRVKEMAVPFSMSEKITTVDHLALILGKVKQKIDLVEKISEREHELFRYLGVEARIDAEIKLETTTPLAVESRLAQIDGDLERAGIELEKRVEERHDARQAIEALGKDGGVARLNESRRSVLLEISSKADRALALHLGLMAADHALAVYRDRHRSELLAQTENAFKAITSGEFSSLVTQPDQSGDQLIAVRANGRSIAVEEMSKGTRFQLYLALRLAGYRRFCAVAGPLPFIGDDIMETFDDGRAESAMRQLGEIAKSGQVLYFTHHRHLCDIAKTVCGDHVKIHEIPKRL